MAVPLQVNQPYTPGFSVGDLPEMQKIAQALMAEMVPEPGVCPWPTPTVSGYAYIPGTSIMLQWGTKVSLNTGKTTVTFPVPFQQAVFTIQLTPWSSAGGDHTASLAQSNPSSLSTFDFEVRTAGALSTNWMTWFAIGI